MPSVVPLGDQAALIYCSDETAALHLANSARQGGVPWLIDVVQAYTSVAVFFDLGQTSFAPVAEWLVKVEASASSAATAAQGRLHRIPCCYEFELDLRRVAEHTGLSSEEIIRLHLGTEYTVYAIGFCPGFPYLGYLPAPLRGVPRLPNPRLRVEPGSVGVTGRQTGIYTEARPGGWNLLGRTPLELVNVKDNYFPLRTGDRVRFERIDTAEFKQLLGQRL